MTEILGTLDWQRLPKDIEKPLGQQFRRRRIRASPDVTVSGGA